MGAPNQHLKMPNLGPGHKTFDSHSPVNKKEEKRGSVKGLGGLMGMLAKAKKNVEKKQESGLPEITSEYPGGFGGKNFLSARNI